MTDDPLTIIQGDCVEKLRELPDGVARCCVTSPPYWGLRSYKGGEKEIGKEATPQEYVAKLVEVFRELRRVLSDDGTLWLNLGDTYAGGGNGGGGSFAKDGIRCAEPGTDKNKATRFGRRGEINGIKSKDLIGIPWMVAFALRADGWYLRSDIIWHKPNPMPESVIDRPTRAHEYIFLFSKQAKYYYDSEAIREPPSPALLKQIEEGYNGEAIKDYLAASVQDASKTKSRIINSYRNRIDKQRGYSRRHAGFNDKWDALTPAEQGLCGSNKRDVWSVAPANFKESHFATFPPDLIKPCILAGSAVGDTVLDPFAGSFTTCAVALELARRTIGIELNPEYIEIGKRRCFNVTPGLPLK